MRCTTREESSEGTSAAELARCELATHLASDAAHNSSLLVADAAPAMEVLHAADAAFIDERYDAAIEGYTAAADEIPGNAEIYTRRAAAHLKLGNYTAAKKDASLSIKMRPAPMSYVRKGRACFALEEWSEARTAFGSALDLDRGANVAVKTVEMQRWIRKCDAELASAGTAASSAVGSAALPPQNARPDAPAAAPPKPDASKIRHEWYQTQTHVVVSVLVRGVSAEQCAVGFDAASVDVSIKLDGSSEYQLSLQLFQKIVPSECKWSVGGAKLELKLKKAAPGKWEALEGDGDGGLESSTPCRSRRPPPPRRRRRRRRRMRTRRRARKCTRAPRATGTRSTPT